MTDNVNNNKNAALETSNIVFATQTIYAKVFMDVSKIEVSLVIISDDGKNVCPPCWTCTKFLLHL